MSQENETGIITLTAGEALASYRRVTLDGTGQAVYAGASEKGIGTTVGAAASGKYVAVKLWNHPGTRKVTVSEATDLGDTLFPTASGKFGDTSTAGGPGMVKALAAGSADGSIVEVITINDVEGNGLVYSNLADSSAITNTVAETAFDLSKTIKGGELKVGDVLEIIARAFLASTNSTDTLNLKLKVGTEVIAATGAVDVANSDIGYIHAFVTVRDVGASGKLSASGVSALGVPGTVTAKPFRLDEATEDLSGDVAITATGTWSVASASNQVILEDLIVIKHRQ